MKLASGLLIVVVAIGCAGRSLHGGNTEPAALPPIPPSLVPHLEALEDANSFAAADKAYAAGAAIDANSPALNEVYLIKMLELGAPERALRQALIVEKVDPTHGLVLGVIAYVQAQRGEMADALAGIIMASMSLPEDPFVVRTAAQLTAWYDLKPDRPEIPGYVKEALADARKELSKQKQFTDAYDEAKAAYKELEAAAEARAAAEAKALAEAPLADASQSAQAQSEPNPVVVPTPQPWTDAPTVAAEPTVIYNEDGAYYPATYDGYDEPTSQYAPTYVAFGGCATFFSGVWSCSPVPSFYEPVCAPVINVGPIININIAIFGGRSRLHYFDDFHRHRDDIVFVGQVRDHDRGLLLGHSYGRDVVMDQARNVFIGSARNAVVNRAGNVAANHAGLVTVGTAHSAVAERAAIAPLLKSDAALTGRPSLPTVLAKEGRVLGDRAKVLLPGNTDPVGTGRSQLLPVVRTDVPTAGKPEDRRPELRRGHFSDRDGTVIPRPDAAPGVRIDDPRGGRTPGLIVAKPVNPLLAVTDRAGAARADKPVVLTTPAGASAEHERIPSLTSDPIRTRNLLPGAAETAVRRTAPLLSAPARESENPKGSALTRVAPVPIRPTPIPIPAGADLKTAAPVPAAKPLPVERRPVVTDRPQAGAEAPATIRKDGILTPRELNLPRPEPEVRRPVLTAPREPIPALPERIVSPAAVATPRESTPVRTAPVVRPPTVTRELPAPVRTAAPSPTPVESHKGLTPPRADPVVRLPAATPPRPLPEVRRVEAPTPSVERRPLPAPRVDPPARLNPTARTADASIPRLRGADGQDNPLPVPPLQTTGKPGDPKDKKPGK